MTAEGTINKIFTLFHLKSCMFSQNWLMFRLHMPCLMLCTDMPYAVPWHALIMPCRDMLYVARWHALWRALTCLMPCRNIPYAMPWHALCITLTYVMPCSDMHHAMPWHTLCLIIMHYYYAWLLCLIIMPYYHALLLCLIIMPYYALAVPLISYLFCSMPFLLCAYFLKVILI